VAFLFDGTVDLTPPVRLLTAGVVGLTVLNRAVRMHGLLLLGLERFSAGMTTVVSIVGSAGLVVGVLTGGVAGALTGLLAAEVLLTVGSLIAAWHGLRRPGQPPTHAPSDDVVRSPDPQAAL
jgi:hypothetical protein